MLRATLVVLLAACTHTHPIDTLPGEVLDRAVTVRTTSGTSLRARAVGGQWVAEDGTTIDGRDVAEVETVSHGRGLLEGMGLGLLAGVAAAGAGFLSGDDPTCEPGTWVCFRWTAGEKALILGVGVGVPGAVVGGLVGLIIGSRDRYVAPAERARVTVAPIPHGGALLVTGSF
jgi:hypothetical protein